MTTKNPRIRTDTSPEREAHLREVAGSDNQMRDAMALVDEARKKADEHEAAAKKYKAQAEFWALSKEDLPPCQNCGRVVLAGKCCDNPKFDPQVTIIGVAIQIPPQNQNSAPLMAALPNPHPHADLIRALRSRGVDLPLDDEWSGFLGSDGRFYNRKQALTIAREAGQLKPDATILHNSLYSNNLR